MMFEPLKPERKIMIERTLQAFCKSGLLPRPSIDPEPIRKLYGEKNYVGMVRFIQKQMNLKDVAVTLGKVKSGGPAETALAWIKMPPPIPIFGSQEFKKWGVTLFIYYDCLNKRPFEMIAGAISHEFSHVVLHSTRDALRESEEATDLFAMTSGYHELYLRAFEISNKLKNSYRKSPYESFSEYFKRVCEIWSGTKYEIATYLTTAEVEFAHQWIVSRLKK